MKKPFFLFALLLVCWVNLKAQSATEVYGIITDPENKEPIPYVNIRFVGTGILKATNSDPEGRYRLRTNDRVDSIAFSFLGYRTKVVGIRRGKTQELNIEMGTGNVELKEITIKAGKKPKREIDTTALYVYARVVENKGRNRPENIETYQYEGYDKMQLSLLNPPEKFLKKKLFKPFRFVFDNEDSTEEGNTYIPGFIKEQVSDVFYRKKDGAIRKVVKADEVSGIDNESISNLASYNLDEIKTYDNLYLIAGKSFTSPFSPLAAITYRYYLTDTVRKNGRVLYRLYFVGKSKEDLAVKGYSLIDSATWAIQFIKFRPNEKSNMNFITDYAIEQSFTLVDNKFWFMDKEYLQTTGSLFKRERNKLSILVQKTNYRRNISTNISIDDSLLKKGEVEVMLDSARHRSRASWDTLRFEPLKRSEALVYLNSDSIPKVPAYKRWEFVGNLVTTAYFRFGGIEFGRFYKFASRNNIEGWRVRMGFRTNAKFSKTIQLQGYVAYGFKDRDWKYNGTIRINLPRVNNRYSALEAYYQYDMLQLGQEDPILTFDNILTLLRGQLLKRIMKVRDFTVSFEKDWLRDYSNILKMSYKTYYDIPGVFNFNRREPNGSLTSIPQFQVTEFSIDNRYSPKQQYYVGGGYRYWVNTKYPVFILNYTYGVYDLRSEWHNYHNLHLIIRQRLSWPAGFTKYQLKAGKIFGDVPYPSAFLTAGNFGYILDQKNYNLLREFEFVSDQYVALWVEHHFDGFFFNKIPGISKLKLREIIVFKGLVGSFSRKNANLIVPTSDLSAPGPIPYMEAGFGFENILRVFRVDFLWRLTYRNKPGAQNWGIKVAFSPRF